MTSTSYLTRYGLEAIWQSQREDEASIIRLNRLTAINGNTKDVRLFQEDYELPTKDGFYHVYMIGGNTPTQLTFPYHRNMWIALSDWCMTEQLVAYLYTDRGILIPNHRAFVLREEDDNYLLAVKLSERLPDLNDQALYLHLYHNEFYTRDQDKPINEQVVYLGAQIVNKGPAGIVTTKFAEYQTKSVRPLAFINGQMKQHFNYTLEKEDILEMTYDGSTLHELWFPISSLPTFQSKIDKKQKYLIHCPKNLNRTKRIFYRDDITLFLCKVPEIQDNNVSRSEITHSRYYHRNLEDSMRMLTHQDWSIPVDYVMSLINDVGEQVDLGQWYIRLIIRDSGINKPLINEKNHIRELYRLNDSLIVKAMVGTNATIKNWQAAELEASSYTYLMRCHRWEVTDEMVLDALGYTQAARVLANPIISITRDINGDYFRVPIGLANQCTVYEYDRFGKLTNFYLHQGDVRYYPRHRETMYIEAIAGAGSINPDYRVNPKAEEVLFPMTNYRVYVAPVNRQGVSGEWKDVTNNVNYFQKTSDNIGFFKYDKETENMIVLGDSRFLSYVQEIRTEDEIYDFSLVTTNQHIPMLIPYGKIDLWLNGSALVEGIDYHIEWPRICIVSKKYINPELEKQLVTVRGTGFVDAKTLERIKPREIGWTTYGRISVDSHYDLHDENISRISIAGSIFDPKTLKFDELTGEARVSPIKDGLPFSIEEYYIPLKGYRGRGDLYQKQIEAARATKAISTYLTKYLRGTKTDRISNIVKEYRVYSPLMSILVHDIVTGNLDVKTINHKDRVAIEKRIRKYLKYLKVDPAYLGIDTDYITIEAFPLDIMKSLDYREYRFLQAVNKIYLNDHIQLSNWVKMTKQ